jgi:hypothetical protein
MVIVMAIICILMTFYLPALVSAKRKAKDTASWAGRSTKYEAPVAGEVDLGVPIDSGESGGGDFPDMSNKGNTKGKTRQARVVISPR